MSLGTEIFPLGHLPVKRTDYEIKNKRNEILQCSHFEGFNLALKGPNPGPCVIYLHCNTGCRLEAVPTLEYLIPKNCSMFCFDFSGCGVSQGEYVTLGHKEHEDLEIILEFISKIERVQKIFLWGRSMGAVTAMIYLSRAKNPFVNGVIIDSAFSNLKLLAEQIAASKTKMPGLLIRGALSLIRKSVLKRTNFDIFEMDLTKLNFNENMPPCLFVTSKEDNFVKSSHTEQLFKMYRSAKKIIYVNGDHNAVRTTKFYEDAVNFIQSVL